MDFIEEIYKTIEVMFQRYISKMKISHQVNGIVLGESGKNDGKYKVRINGEVYTVKDGVGLAPAPNANVWVNIPNNDWNQAYICAGKNIRTGFVTEEEMISTRAALEEEIQEVYEECSQAAEITASKLNAVIDGGDNITVTESNQKLVVAASFDGVVDVKVDGTSVVTNQIAELSSDDFGKVKDVKVDNVSVLDENGVAFITTPTIPVTDVQVDGSTVMDGTIAKITMPTIPTVPVQDVQVDNVSILNQQGIANLNSSDFGTTVVANPSGTPTDGLETIQIGNTIYDISGGGGSSPNYGKFTCDELFVNDPLPSPTSGTNSVTRTYTLSKSIDDYDAVYVAGWMWHNENYDEQMLSNLLFKKDYYIQGGEDATWSLNGSTASDRRQLIVNIIDSTTIQTKSWRTESGNEPVLYKVYGLKFQNKLINRSDIYSEDEQMVGRWIDEKPLYQKTFNFGTLPNDTYKDVSTGLTNVKIIKSEGYSCGSSGTVELPYVSVTSVGTSIGYAVLSDNTIRISTGSDRTAFTETYITLWYTKNTDQPGSGFIPEDPQLVYMSDYYSEDEQVVGRWVNGKPLYQRTFIRTPNDLVNGSASSSQVRGELRNLIPADADIINIVDDLSYLHVPWGSSNVTIRSTSLNYTSGSAYIRANIQEDNNSLRFIFVDITYQASQIYQYYMNTAKIIVTLQYTKTTDAEGTGPTKGNIMYLPALYSKEEREVGVWYDGKPMHQRTFEGANQITTSGDEIPIQLDLQNIDKICYFWGGAFSTAGGSYQQNRNQDGLYFVPYLVTDAGLSYWKIGSTWTTAQYGSNMRYRITVQYTKTTDQPGSGLWSDASRVATDADIEQLQTNFQDGVDSVYDACVAKGSTPESHALSDVVDAIGNISGGIENIYELATALMTSNTTPSGVCSCSQTYNNTGNYDAWYAFSGTLGGDRQSWCTYNQTEGAWIQYQFPTAVVITKLITTNRNNGSTSRACRIFKFQGSNDGTTFIDLGDNYNITSSASSYQQTFYIPNQTAYLYYRIYVVEAYDNTTRVGFGQIEMYKSSVVTCKTITQNGLYVAENDGYDGYNCVKVQVPSASGESIEFASEVIPYQLNEESVTSIFELNNFTFTSEAGGV